MPELYNQHYINQYAFPKSLQVYRKAEEQKRNPHERVSIYDMNSAPQRQGISGWKLTKKALGTSPTAAAGITLT